MTGPFSLGVIPVRGGSKGVPRKNIRLLGQKPLLAYTLSAAQNSQMLSHTVVSTEDAEIADIAQSFGGQVVWRPNSLAQDETPSLPVVQHALLEVEAAIDIVFDYAVVLQATTPFRTYKDIDGVLEKLIGTGADSVVSVVKLDEFHPWKIKKIDGDRLVPYMDVEEEGTRRQDLPAAFVRNGGVYAVKRSVLMDRNSLYGDDCRAYIMPRNRSVDINDELDFLFAEALVAKNMI